MQEINLYDLIKYYVKKWRIIVALTLLGLIAGLIYNTFIQKPLYQSNTKLLIVAPQDKSTTTDSTLINNYIDLIKSRRVLIPVIAKQNTNISYDNLSKSVAAVNQKSTQVIEVTVKTPKAEESKSVANNITDSFKAAVRELYHTDNIVVVDPAVTAVTPYNVHQGRQITLAAGAGFAISIIVLFFIYDVRRDNGEMTRRKRNHASVRAKKNSPKKSVRKTSSLKTTKI